MTTSRAMGGLHGTSPSALLGGDPASHVPAHPATFAERDQAKSGHWPAAFRANDAISASSALATASELTPSSATRAQPATTAARCVHALLVSIHMWISSNVRNRLMTPLGMRRVS